MALIVADRVQETSTTTGTGNFTLGGAVTGFQAFSSVLATADTTYYTIADQGGANWEVGLGTFTSPSTLARTTILSSSNAGSAVNFTAGTKSVFITYPAGRSVLSNASGVVPVPAGGTGAATLTANNVLLGNGTSAVQFVAPSTSGNVLTSNGTSWTSAAASPTNGYRRNRIINGGMQIDQRNAGASVIFNSSVFSTDRWQSVTTQSSKLNAQQNAGSVTPPPGFSYYLGITVSSAVSVAAGDLFILRQSIEGYNIEDFAWGTADAQPVTLSFWVRSSLTGINSGALVNALSTRSYPFTFTISAASTWEYKTITVPGDTTGTWSTNNGVGVYLRFNLGSGSTFLGTSNSWNAGNFTGATGSISIIGTSGATFYITGVQLEAGSSATPFERLPIGETLMLCQRYFLKLGGSVSADIYTSIYTVNGFASLALTYPVTMRANATGTIVGSWTSSNVSGTPSLFPGNSSVGIQIPATVAPGSVTYYTSGTSTYLTFSAEL